MTFQYGQHPVLLEKVFELINTKLPPDTATLVTEFTLRLYRQLPYEDLVILEYSDIYSAVLSLWHTYNRYQPIQPSVKVYNPQLTTQGWESPHTVIEIVQQDRPFLVDSVRLVLKRFGLKPHSFLQSLLYAKRKSDGTIESLIEAGIYEESASSEAVFLIEVDRLFTPEQLDELKQDILFVLSEIELAVSDWQAMKVKLNTVAESLEQRTYLGDIHQKADIRVFLEWLAQDNFILLGYRGYHLIQKGREFSIQQEEGSSLGVMRNTESTTLRSVSEMTIQAQEAITTNQDLILLTKTNQRSRIHRGVYTDYIGIKRFDQQGQVIGEDRFIGLYGSRFYHDSALYIPMISNKINQALELSKYAPHSYARKSLLNILQNFPREEILQSSSEHLLTVALGVFQNQDKLRARVFIRRDVFGRFITAMVYVARERYNTELHNQIEGILRHALGAFGDIESHAFFSESPLARTQYTLRVKDSKQEIDVSKIEQDIQEAVRSWEDNVESLLISAHGEELGKSHIHQFVQGMPRAYKEDVVPAAAIADIVELAKINDNHELGMLFYRPQEAEKDSERVRLKLFHAGEPIFLSDVLPMLENFGLRIIDETPYEIKTPDNKSYWILDFSMVNGSGSIDLDAVRDNFQQAFISVWNDQLEDDGFNKLVLSAGMTGRQVVVLRLFSKYMRQLGSTFGQRYIQSTFGRYPNIAELIIQYFNTKFKPGLENVDAKLTAIEEEIQGLLASVSSLDDDRIIRRYLDLIKAAVRTNFFQKAKDGNNKDYISVKFLPNLIPDSPKPVLAFEVFVYSPRVEGVHLRAGKVARGGLRWSDRNEDFRTEVLSLVKTQHVKNTAIIPVGAKGGFVAKQLPTEREAFLKEGQECYKIFIRGLLDLADNIIDGEVVHAPNVVRYDEDDTYVVVAADKGTATFSDIANEISAEYNFWLGDAFASGGSAGYDHKAMGITASGGWESVKRHFREIGVNCQTTDFTCVGIGDMGGDVFGNGMLQSEHIRLKGAFNHLHIFVDPNPDAAKTFPERERLFKTPRTTWKDFNPELISQGGGVFDRSAKSIPVSPEMKEAFGIEVDTVAPNDLIKALLTSEVDLLWNGGIGTYVKSAKESHDDVGDRANNGVRVNGADVRATIIGEGGNLGMTQLGRVEYAQKGGRLNTDFIDNVGGVSSSDVEVNFKILLNLLFNQGRFTIEERNKWLKEMTEDVRNIVLTLAARQTQSISVTEVRGIDQVKELQRFIQELEHAGQLSRELEDLPDDEALTDRITKGQTFTRPELSIITAYGKMVLKEAFAIPEIANDPYHAKELANYFPELLREKFAADLDIHPLRTDIIATQLASNIVNDMGPNFVLRKQEATGATPAEIAAAYVISREVYEAHRIRDEIEALDNVISADLQNKILFQVRRMVRRTSRWFLRHQNPDLNGIQENIDFYKPAFDDLRVNALNYCTADEVEEISAEIDQLVQQGVPADLARRIGLLSTIFSSMDIAEIAAQTNQEIATVAKVYYHLGNKIELHWFLHEISAQPIVNHWQALARAAFREELDWQQRALTATVFNFADKASDADAMLTIWLEEYAAYIERWTSILDEFKVAKNHEFAKFSVALRELMLLGHKCGSLK